MLRWRPASVQGEAFSIAQVAAFGPEGTPAAPRTGFKSGERTDGKAVIDGKSILDNKDIPAEGPPEALAEGPPEAPAEGPPPALPLVPPFNFIPEVPPTSP